ncbi:MAG: AEC family transporter [Lachnospiraceae bacterium]|nr:AEC family transporter [Lachnospiraceae bacterium]
MLENFIIAAEAVLPVFLLILLGMGARRLQILNDLELKHVNNAVFQVMFPFMMFYNIYTADFSGALDLKYFVFCVGMLFLVYALGTITALVVEKENRNRGALIQAIYRGNLVLMGIPVMENLMGEEALGLTTIMLAVIVPLYNILAVVTLEVFRGGKMQPFHMLKKILTNPLILGAAAGIGAVLFRVNVPGVFLKPMGQIASAATPAALLIMGASFYFQSVHENMRNIVLGVAGKLIVSPGLALAAGYVLGFRGISLALLIVIFGAPCAVSSYTMAQQMDSNAELAAGCLLFSSLFSCVTICGWIFLCRQAGAF